LSVRPSVAVPPLFHRTFLKRLLPFCLAIITIGSFLPTELKQAIGTQSKLRDQITRDWRHRCYHVVSFGVTGLLITLVNLRRRRSILFCIALLGLAGAIELAQAFVFTSELEWWDLRDDFLGIALL